MDNLRERQEQQALKEKRRADAVPEGRARRIAQIEARLARGDYVRQGTRDWLAATVAAEKTARRKGRAA